jgi:hypothetical protein
MDTLNTLNLLCRVLELNAYCRECIIEITLQTAQSVPYNEPIKEQDSIQELVSQLQYAINCHQPNLSTLQPVQLELLLSAKQLIQIANSLSGQLGDFKNGNQSATFAETAALFGELLVQKLQKSLSHTEKILRKRLIPKLW